MRGVYFVIMPISIVGLTPNGTPPHPACRDVITWRLDNVLFFLRRHTVTSLRLYLVLTSREGWRVQLLHDVLLTVKDVDTVSKTVNASCALTNDASCKVINITSLSSCSFNLFNSCSSSLIHQ